MSLASSASASGFFSSIDPSEWGYLGLKLPAASTIPIAPSAMQMIAARSASPPSPPAAAIIAGEGVSPAASAAAKGSPPGSAAATSVADFGRADGSFSKHRTIARSTVGSMSATTLEGRTVDDSSCACINSGIEPAL